MFLFKHVTNVHVRRLVALEALAYGRLNFRVLLLYIYTSLFHHQMVATHTIKKNKK